MSLIEPGFTRTNLDQNEQVARHPLELYARDRGLAREAVRSGIANGEEPARVASVVWEALVSPSPRVRYPAGRSATSLSRLKRFAPAGLLDKGVRKQFGLKAG